MFLWLCGLDFGGVVGLGVDCYMVRLIGFEVCYKYFGVWLTRCLQDVET